jgi:hypothetical protein
MLAVDSFQLPTSMRRESVYTQNKNRKVAYQSGKNDIYNKGIYCPVVVGMMHFYKKVKLDKWE